MITLPLDDELVKRFFDHVVRGEYSKAEPIIKELSQSKLSEWELGYLSAMNGVLLSMKGGDKPYAYRSLLEERFVKKYEVWFKEVLKLDQPFLDDYEKGYFRCWLDLLNTVLEHLNADREKLS